MRNSLIRTIIIFVLCIGVCFALASCKNKNVKQNNNNDIAAVVTGVKGAIDKLIVDNEKKSVSFIVENDVDTFDISNFDCGDAAFEVYSNEDLTERIQSVINLNEGVNTFYIVLPDNTDATKYIVTITRHIHTFSDKWTSDDFYHWHVSTCDHNDVAKDKSAHDWNDGEITSQPTEEKEGVKTFTCKVCGKIKTNKIEKLSCTQTFSSEWTFDENYHWHAATCAHKDQVKEKAAHVWVQDVVTLEPTEEKEGEITYLCSVCGKRKTTTVEKLPHTHTFDDGWSSDEFYHWHAATCAHKDQVKDQAAHVWGQDVVTLEPTEEKEGEKTSLCSVCGKRKTTTVEKLPHTHKYESDYSSDDKYHWYAAACGHKVVKDKTQHEWGDPLILKNATEEEKGIKAYICKVCGHTVEVDIPVLPHTHKFSSDWTSDPNYHWHAAVCDHTDQISGKSAHSWDDGLITVQPTEEKEGEKTYLCSVCGREKKEILQRIAHVHTYQTESWTSDAEYHWHAATCAHSDLFIDKDVHAWDDGKVTKEATETTKGIMSFACLICGKTKTEEIPVLPHTHTFALEWSFDADYHWHTATCVHFEQTSDKATHDWVDDKILIEATEIVEGQKQQKCSVCGKTRIVVTGYSTHEHTFSSTWSYDGDYHWHAATCAHVDEVKDKTAHVWNDGIVIAAATEELGEQTKYTCTICQKDKIETTSAPKTHEHIFNETVWEYDSLYHWHPALCIHTQEKGAKAEHSYGEWSVTKPSTEEVKGEETRACSICGKTQTREIPLLPHTYSTIWSHDENYHWHAATCGHDAFADKSSHAWSEPTRTKEPTIYEEGENTYTCTICNRVKKESIPELPSYKLSFVYYEGETLIDGAVENVRVPIYEGSEPEINGVSKTVSDRSGCRFAGWNIPYEERVNNENTYYFFSYATLSEKAKENMIVEIHGRYICQWTVSFVYFDENDDAITIPIVISAEYDNETQEIAVVTVNSILVDNNGTVMCPDAPEREGYRFEDWDYDNVYDEYVYEIDGVYYTLNVHIATQITEDIQIVARYVKQRMITLKYDDGEIYDTIVLDDGGSLILPEISKTGYVFKGWKTSTDEIVNGNVTISDDVVYVAVFNRSYSVTFEYFNNDVKTIETVAIESGDRVYAPEKFTENGKTGYNFVNWKVDGETREYVETLENGYEVNEDLYFTATYAIKTYDVTFVLPDGTSSTTTVAHGFIATPPSERPEYVHEFNGGPKIYGFTAWRDENGNDINSGYISQNTDFYAVYESAYEKPVFTIQPSKEEGKMYVDSFLSMSSDYLIYALNVEIFYDECNPEKESQAADFDSISNSLSATSYNRDQEQNSFLHYAWTYNHNSQNGVNNGSSQYGVKLKKEINVGNEKQSYQEVIKLKLSGISTAFVLDENTFKITKCTVVIGIKDEDGNYVAREVDVLVEYLKLQ